MTETTQPEPQVVAWMRDYRRRNPLASEAEIHIAADHVLGSGVGTHIPYDVLHASVAESARPLTPGDVPAGQGPASLHITSTGGRPALWFKADDGTLHFIRWAAGPGDTPPARALWDHLTATITHVTTKEP